MASSSTSEEIEIINNIKEGTQKLIENILLDEIESPKEYANRKAHTKIRPSTHTFLIHDIIQIFRTDRNYIFRLIDLKKRLPDRLKVIEDYDSELTRIIQSLVCSNLIVHSSRLPTKRVPDIRRNMKENIMLFLDLNLIMKLLLSFFEFLIYWIIPMQEKLFITIF